MKLKIAKSTLVGRCVTLAACAVLLVGRADAGTWTAPGNMNPAGTGNCFLLSDGTILDDNGGQQIAILHPDASGNYANGTWTLVTSPSPYYSWCSPDAMLSDGTFMKFGGEYGPGA